MIHTLVIPNELEQKHILVHMKAMTQIIRSNRFLQYMITFKGTDYIRKKKKKLHRAVQERSLGKKQSKKLKKLSVMEI